MHETDAITGKIIGAAIQIHEQFGPGLLESVYTLCLGQELLENGLAVEIGKPLSLSHKAVHINRAFVVDLLVEDCVIVEVKSVSSVAPVHRAQLLTYLRLLNIRVGLILNFKVTRMTDGIHRVVNNHVDENGVRL